MKNIITDLLLVFVVAFVFMVSSVNAMTEVELKGNLSNGREVNGVTFKPTDSQKVLMERYLDKYEVSSEDADYIVKKLDEVFDILKKSGKKSFYDLSKNEKQEIINKVAEVASSTSVDVRIIGDDLVIYVPNTNRGEVFYQTPIHPTSNGEIAQTSRGIAFMSIGVFAILGVLVALKKVRNA